MSESNPFADQREDQRVYNQPLPEAVIYQLTPRTAPVDPSDIETGEAAIEVVILWGELSILHVAHLSPPRAFCVGDAADADFLIGSETLGTERLPIVVEHGSRVAIAIPAGATGDVTIADQVVSFEELAAQDQLVGAGLYPLPLGATARIQYRGFTFIVNQTSAARRVGVGAGERRSLKEYVWTIASLLVHASLLVAFQFLPPHSSVLSVDLLNADSRLAGYFIEPLEKIEEDKPEWLEDKADAEGGTGKSHADDQGQMGKQDQPRTNNKYAIKGPADNPTPQMARAEAKAAAATAGLIGVLRASMGAWNSPTSIYGGETAIGRDPENEIGNLLGNQTGANAGFLGLGSVGTGRGGGGDGKGTIGSGDLGTIGHGNGTGDGDGYGKGAGGAFRDHTTKVPHVRVPPPDVYGSLKKETIRRVIGLHINEVRHCYSQELNTHPDLQGRVTVKFIITPTGAVQTAVTEKSDLGNAVVEQCVTKAVRRWAFPQPEGGGLVIVSYPFVFSQTGN